MATSGFMKGKGDAKKSVSAGQVSGSKINTASPSKGYVKPGKAPNTVGSKPAMGSNKSGAGKGLGKGVSPNFVGSVSAKSRGK